MKSLSFKSFSTTVFEAAFETGWLDLEEWGMIALWRAAERSGIRGAGES